MDWDNYSFIVRSQFRLKIIESLKYAKIPTHIARETNSSLPNVSRTLSEFKKRGIVECVNPKERVGKLYKLTKDGKEILEYYQKSMRKD